jgi:hypothetical protein
MLDAWGAQAGHVRGLPGHLDALIVWLLKSRPVVCSGGSGRTYPAISAITLQSGTNAPAAFVGRGGASQQGAHQRPVPLEPTFEGI